MEQDLQKQLSHGERIKQEILKEVEATDFSFIAYLQPEFTLELQIKFYGRDIPNESVRMTINLPKNGNRL